MQGSAWGLGVRGYPPSLSPSPLLFLPPSLYSSFSPSLHAYLLLSVSIFLFLSLFSFFLIYFKTLQQLLSQNLVAYAFQEGKFANCNRVLFCFVLFSFVLKLSSRITEPAGLLPTQQDKQSRAWKMKAKPTRRKET